METAKVGIREFRSDLAEYIASGKPVAVTRHGQTVGYFIPTQGQLEANVAALKKTSKTLDKLLASQNVDVDSVVADFKIARKKVRAPAKKLKGLKSKAA
jgi:antitoxin (DNA-binding transcriptional repressor) of toxin-antitoxin stability system